MKKEYKAPSVEALGLAAEQTKGGNSAGADGQSGARSDAVASMSRAGTLNNGSPEAS